MQISTLCRPLLALFAVVAPVSSASAGTLLVDDGGGPGVFTTIQAAIDAATAGDVILVNPGTYPGFTLDKPLSILGSDPTSASAALVQGSILLRDIPAGEAALLSNFRASSVLRLQDNSGRVVLDKLRPGSLWIQVCDDVRAHDLETSSNASNLITASRVEIVESHLRGGDAPDSSCLTASPGSPGLSVSGDSVVHLVRTSLTGGSGGSVGCSFFAAGAGGSGLFVGQGATVHVSGESGTTLRGGDGGLGDTCFWDGVAGAGARVVDGTLFHSGAAFLSGESCNFVPPGLAVDSGVAIAVTPAEPTLGWTGSTAAGTETRFELQGPAGAPALIAFGSSAVQVPFPAAPLGLLTSADVALLVGQTDPGTGGLSFLLGLPPALPAGLLIPTQGAILFASGEWRLTNSVTLLVR